jgi:hypothetical protein
MGRTLPLVLGQAIPAAELANLPRGDVAGVLRRRTMDLATRPLRDPDEVFRWPSHVKW